MTSTDAGTIRTAGKGELPRISVLVPSHRRADSLRSLLAALAQQTYPIERFEVVVVLDGPDPDSERLLAAHGTPLDLRWFVIPHHGETAARNRALQEARAELVLCLDDDIVPVPGLIAEHVRAHEEQPGGVVMGALAIAPDSPERFLGEIADFTVVVQQRCAVPGYEPSNIDFLEGNFSIARADLLAVGAWDEHFVDYGSLDDLELGCRFLKHGLRFRYLPSAMAYHKYVKDLASLLIHSRLIGRAQVYYYSKHPDRLQDLRFPLVIRGPVWKRWPLRWARVAPEFLFALVPSAASRLRHWRPRRFLRTKRFIVRAMLGIFFCRGLWDTGELMESAYRYFRSADPASWAGGSPPTRTDAVTRPLTSQLRSMSPLVNGSSLNVTATPVVDVVSGSDGLSALRQEWNRTWESSGTGNLFTSFDWIDAFWRVYGDDPAFWGEKELFVLVVRSGGKLAGIAPLRRRRARRLGITVNVLDFITGTETYQDFVLENRAENAIEAIAAYLASIRTMWDVLDLRNFPPWSPTPGLLSAALQRSGIRNRTGPDSACYYLPVTGPWSSFLQAQPGRRRKLLRRQSRQLEDAGITIRIVEDPQNEPGVLPAILELERQKALRRGQEGLSEKDVGQFLRALLERFGPKRTTYVALAEQGSTPLAYQLGFKAGDAVWDFCTAFNPRFARYSPGTMLMPQVLDWAYRQGAREFDFLRGNLGYKRAWTPAFRRNTRLLAWNAGAASLLYVWIRPFVYRWLSRARLRPVPDWEI